MKLNTSEIFKWKDNLIRQDEKVFKIGTDAILLGAWIPEIIHDASYVLDVGTGTGILSIMIASHFPNAKITAIDSDQDTVELAYKNFMQSSHAGNMEVECADLFEEGSSLNKKYDLVVCNPPYYPEGNYLKPQWNADARQGKQPVKYWVESLIKKVETKGHLFLVIPFEMVFEWIQYANRSGHYCQHQLNVFSFENNINPKRCLLHFSDELIKPSFSRLTIYSHDNNYTEEFIALTGINRKAMSSIGAAGF